MTVIYANECATVSNFGNFWKLLLRWKASIYKLVWMDLLVFLFLNYSVGLCYSYLLPDSFKEPFQLLCGYCKTQMSLIPLSFVLGFYVSSIISRWGKQFNSFPLPKSVAIFVAASIVGADERSRLMRRAIVRYVNLALIIMMMDICTPVKKRFPTPHHLVAAGMMFESELHSLDHVKEKLAGFSVFWVPLIWASNVVVKARKLNKITHDIYVDSILEKICEFRGKCTTLLTYDWIPIPLVYTQVVTLAVYTFFLADIFGRQVIHSGSKLSDHIDLYFPVFTILQFLFYMGWLKVSETLLNPFGEDDDDFEINILIDRNIQCAFAIVDEVNLNPPDLVEDQYWAQIIPDILPYPQESQRPTNSPQINNIPISLRRMSATSRTLSVGERTQIRMNALLSSSVDNKSQGINVAFLHYPKVQSFFARLFSFVSMTKKPETAETAKTQRRIRFNDPMERTLFNSLMTRVNRGVNVSANLNHPQTSIENESLLEDVISTIPDLDSLETDGVQSDCTF